MKSVVVGAGPIGLVSALGLAAQGRAVTVIDRDPGPGADGTWSRRGVMQFEHPHAFRPIVGEVLHEVAPRAMPALIAAGCVPVRPPGAPHHVAGLLSRRSTFERALRELAGRTPGITLRTGNVEDVVLAGGRLRGLRVDGAEVPADLAVLATGRSARLTELVSAPAEGGPCGLSYVTRLYSTRPGQEPLGGVHPTAAFHDGYTAIVFPHDAGTHSVLLVRASNDDELALARNVAVFDSLAWRIPVLADAVDPRRFTPLTDPQAGGGLTNTYRSQTEDGRPALPGVVLIGDAVSTTNPSAGRGVSLGLRQVRALLRLLATEADLGEVAVGFDAWCEQEVRPWYLDHVLWDATLLRRWSGRGLDLAAPIPSDVVCAAAAVIPAIAPAAGAYGAMAALPSVLDPFRPVVRDLMSAGWQPEWAAGPTRAELVSRLAA